MEGIYRSDRIGTAVRKKRTHASRRPKPDYSSLSTSPPSEDIDTVSSDDGNGMKPRKEVNVNQFVNRVYSGNKTDSAKVRVSNKDGEFKEFYNNEPGRNSFSNKRSSEGVLAPANWKRSKTADSNGDSNNDLSSSGRKFEIPRAEQSNLSGNESKVKKMKLKVGGVTRTIQANSMANGTSNKVANVTDSSRFEQRQYLKGQADDGDFLPKKSGLQGIPWKDFSRGGITIGKRDLSTKNTPSRSGVKGDPPRKSKRVLKKRPLDGEFGDDYEDDEIRYLEKLKGPKMTVESTIEDGHGSRQKLWKASSVAKAGAAKSKANGEDADYEDEEEPPSDTEPETAKGKKLKKEHVEPLTDSTRGISLTTRQRALQSNKDGVSSSNANLVEFPDGLPPAPPRKQKEKLTEMEQQLKKAEAAERRRLQNEKAARESEAEAIRRILGQDSGRKKREDKIKKRQEVIAQEKAANSLTVPSNTIRYVMGPTGTVVTFPSDMGLPSIFTANHSSYPPLREKCAGPSCTNPYRYRDSKSKLPLCSLQCYKAVHAQASC